MVGLEHLELLLRVMLGVTFAASAFAKLRDRRAFTAAVEDFDVVPRRRAGPVASAVIATEVLLVVLLAIAGPVLVVAFSVAAALLIAFTVALAQALHHRNVVSCNCFGTATARLSRLDLIRNVCLIAAAAGGCVVAVIADGRAVGGAQAAVVTLAGIGLAMLVINCPDVLRTMLRPFSVPGLA